MAIVRLSGDRLCFAVADQDVVLPADTAFVAYAPHLRARIVKAGRAEYQRAHLADVERQTGREFQRPVLRQRRHEVLHGRAKAGSQAEQFHRLQRQAPLFDARKGLLPPVRESERLHARSDGRLTQLQSAAARTDTAAQKAAVGAFGVCHNLVLHHQSVKCNVSR